MQVECRFCSKIIYAGEELKCSVSRCQEKFHFNCGVKDTVNFTVDSFKCPQHVSSEFSSFGVFQYVVLCKVTEGQLVRASQCEAFPSGFQS